jgi:hypothetical protein
MADNTTTSGSFGDTPDQGTASTPPSTGIDTPVTTPADNTSSAAPSDPTGGTTIDIGDAGTAGAATPEPTPIDEPFVGSGGVGSADYMDALRRGHEEAGGDYASNLGSPDDTQGTA